MVNQGIQLTKHRKDVILGELPDNGFTPKPNSVSLDFSHMDDVNLNKKEGGDRKRYNLLQNEKKGEE